MEKFDIVPSDLGSLPPIEADWAAHKSKRISQRPQNNLRASTIGHPCDRYHYHSIVDWQERPLHDVGLQSIFDEGNLHEKAIIRELTDMGYEIVEQQRSFQHNDPLITAHIDFILRYKGVDYPVDAKSTNPYDFDHIQSAEDMLYGRSLYMRQYPAQLQIYLTLTGARVGAFLLKNKLTGEFKPIWMQADAAYVKVLIDRARRVYAAIAQKTPPARTTNLDTCASCPFQHICLPDIKSECGVKDLDDPDLNMLLERRAQLEAVAKEYDAIDKSINKVKDFLGAGEYTIGQWILRVKSYSKREKIPITWREEKVTYLRKQLLKIGELGKEKNDAEQ